MTHYVKFRTKRKTFKLKKVVKAIKNVRSKHWCHELTSNGLRTRDLQMQVQSLRPARVRQVRLQVT